MAMAVAEGRHCEGVRMVVRHLIVRTKRWLDLVNTMMLNKDLNKDLNKTSGLATSYTSQSYRQLPPER
jgi:hypothetical protein